MNLTNEFKEYVIRQHGIDNLYHSKIAGSTVPYIMGEHRLSIVQVDVFPRPMTDKIVFLGAGVNGQVAGIIAAQLLFSESVDSGKDTQMYIGSPDDSVYTGLGIYGTMQFTKPDIATVCIGIAASMAAILLCVGTEGRRFALPYSHVVIHQPSRGAQGVASDTEVDLKEMLKLRNKLYEITARHSKRPFAKVYRDSEYDYRMITRETKEYGMIDEVLERK